MWIQNCILFSNNVSTVRLGFNPRYNHRNVLSCTFLYDKGNDKSAFSRFQLVTIQYATNFHLLQVSPMLYIALLQDAFCGLQAVIAGNISQYTSIQIYVWIKSYFVGTTTLQLYMLSRGAANSGASCVRLVVSKISIDIWCKRAAQT